MKKSLNITSCDLAYYLKERRAFVDAGLRQMLPSAGVRPKVLHQAMRYSVFAGGKRLRPILCLAAAEACSSGDSKIAFKKALPAACALECLHTYSLIHDDLPAMDNDDWRRGKPTAHKAFGEGTAILAGDALLTMSFELLSNVMPTSRYSMASFLKEMTQAAGSKELIGGQAADLEAEGKKIKLADVQFIHERKTAAMIALALRLGAMTANASPKKLQALTQFGKTLGLAFQIVDDILDVTQSQEQLGKSAKKDLSAQKATYPAVIGLAASEKKAASLTAAADEALRPLGSKGDRLQQIAKYLLKRTS